MKKSNLSDKLIASHIQEHNPKEKVPAWRDGLGLFFGYTGLALIFALIILSLFIYIAD